MKCEVCGSGTDKIAIGFSKPIRCQCLNEGCKDFNKWKPAKKFGWEDADEPYDYEADLKYD